MNNREIAKKLVELAESIIEGYEDPETGIYDRDIEDYRNMGNVELLGELGVEGINDLKKVLGHVFDAIVSSVDQSMIATGFKKIGEFEYVNTKDSSDVVKLSATDIVSEGDQGLLAQVHDWLAEIAMKTIGS